MAECVLVYINHTKTSALAKWLADKFQALTFINYEQLNMTDRQVLTNFQDNVLINFVR